MKWEQRITKLKREPLSVPRPVLATTSVPVLFVAAKGRQCRYPLWDDATPAEKRMVCGAPATEGASWCVGHSKAVFAYDPRPDRRGPAPGPRMDGEASAVTAAARLAATCTWHPAAYLIPSNMLWPHFAIERNWRI